MEARETFIKENPVRNRLGPPLPTWFVKAFQREFPGFVFQYTPPRSLDHPRGVNPTVYPGGVWDICYRMPFSGFLHPRVTWSLVDCDGNYSPPDPRTLRFLRALFYFQRRDQVDKVEELMDANIAGVAKERAMKHKHQLHTMMQRCSGLMHTRQWTNRASLFQTSKGVETCNPSSKDTTQRSLAN